MLILFFNVLFGSLELLNQGAVKSEAGKHHKAPLIGKPNPQGSARYAHYPFRAPQICMDAYRLQRYRYTNLCRRLLTRLVQSSLSQLLQIYENISRRLKRHPAQRRTHRRHDVGEGERAKTHY